MSKKSNNPEVGRSFQNQRQLVYGRTLPWSERKELEAIQSRALYLERDNSRSQALEYIQSNRAWLEAFYRGITLPTNTTLLDQWKEQGKQLTKVIEKINARARTKSKSKP